MCQTAQRHIAGGLFLSRPRSRACKVGFTAGAGIVQNAFIFIFIFGCIDMLELGQDESTGPYGSSEKFIWGEWALPPSVAHVVGGPLSGTLFGFYIVVE
jgi:hypothetical protein